MIAYTNKRGGRKIKGKRLLEKSIPAWEEAQHQAAELLGDEGIALLDRTARKVGMSQAGR
jgi:hypothetical protein